MPAQPDTPTSQELREDDDDDWANASRRAGVGLSHLGRFSAMFTMHAILKILNIIILYGVMFSPSGSVFLASELLWFVTSSHLDFIF